MSLSVETPAPPQLTDSGHAPSDDRRIESSADLHREDIESALANGAWDRGFGEWADHTDLTDAEWAAVEELGYVQEFDFFWDDSEGRVGYSSPGIPENWRQQNLHPALDSWSTVSSVNAALSQLGRTVADVLTVDYVDWTDSTDDQH